MSIYLVVIKELIKDKLNGASVAQSEKTKNGAINPLADAQKKTIDALNLQIGQFKSLGDDLQDSKAIEEMVREARKTIWHLRKKTAGVIANSGKTMDCLTTLFFLPDQFYEKIEEFQLVDKAYQATSPQGVVDYLAGSYLCEELITPNTRIEPDVRDAKELYLKNKLKWLKEFKPSTSIVDTIDKCSEILTILLTENFEASKHSKYSTISRVSNYFFATPFGRLEVQIRKGLDELAKMKEQTLLKYRVEGERKLSVSESKTDHVIEAGEAIEALEDGGEGDDDEEGSSNAPSSP